MLKDGVHTLYVMESFLSLSYSFGMVSLLLMQCVHFMFFRLHPGDYMLALTVSSTQLYMVSELMLSPKKMTFLPSLITTTWKGCAYFIYR